MNIVQPADPVQLRQALALLIARPDLSRAEIDQQIQYLTDYASKYRLSLEHCLVARRNGADVAVCLCVDSPGRTSSLFIPAVLDRPDVREAVCVLLEEASVRAGNRRIQFLQSMVAPESVQEAAVYRQAGFQNLAQLLYLENDLTQPVLPHNFPPKLDWATYTAQTHPLFANVVAGSYEESLDCGSLNGLRDIEDILASHRATGIFDPRHWLLGTVDGKPTGVILLTEVPERFAIEVVYMGLLKRWRGIGYGSALLRRAVELAREKAVVTLMLSVDVRNEPARKLYQRFGFQEISRRDAWIKILRSPSAAQAPC